MAAMPNVYFSVSWRQ